MRITEEELKNAIVLELNFMPESELLMNDRKEVVEYIIDNYLRNKFENNDYSLDECEIRVVDNVKMFFLGE